MAKHIIQPRLMELESYLDSYFNQNIAPKLTATIKSVTAKRLGQLDKDTSMTFAHSFASTRTARIGIDDVQMYATSKAFKGLNSEIMKELNKSFKNDRHLQKDLAKISMEIRVHLLQTMAKRYGSETKAISVLKSVNLANGKDIVSAYVSEALANKAVNKLAARQMPKSTFEYVIKHGLGDSIYGLMLFPSDDVDDAVRAQSEKKFHPAEATKITATTVSSVVDTASLGGDTVCSFLVGISLDNLSRKGLDKYVTSKHGDIGYIDAASVLGDIYNGSKTSFKYAEEHAASYHANHSVLIQQLNQQMNKKVYGIKAPPQEHKEAAQTVLPHSRDSHRRERMYAASVAAVPQTVPENAAGYQGQSANGTINPVGDSKQTDGVLQNAGGWDDLLQKAVTNLGLTGFSDIHKNIGYVLAMLPDMLMGMFTGKNPNLKIQDNLMPLAAIMGGLFIKNPLLKLMMLGLGGAKLLNTTGHEALREAGIGPSVHYKKYDDETLDKRLSSPKLQGNNLVFSVDGVPTVAAVSDMVVDAYNQGALPLNTLANRVLAKYDEQQQHLSASYSNNIKEEEVEEQSRGLK